MSLFIGVYQALYDYGAQNEEELTISTGELLYLLEKSDVDDWWKVKKRVVSSGGDEVEEPVGLVPSNYIEPAPVVKTAVALYEYNKQTEEELSFDEGAKFNIYDVSDPDWYLAGDVATGTTFGFLPSNYVEIGELGGGGVAAATAAPISTPTTTTAITNADVTYRPNASTTNLDKELPPHPLEQSPYKEQSPLATFPPPPKHQSLSGSRERVVSLDGNDDEEAPPPMPSRPNNNNNNNSMSMSARHDYDDDEESAPPTPSRPMAQDSNDQEHSFDGEYFTWYLDEIEGKKKRAIVLSVGKGLIILKPNTKKYRLKSASLVDNQWKIKDLLDYSFEKKHFFLEFKNPHASIELHTGSKDVAEAIFSVLGDLKGATTATALREVERASHTTTNAKNRKIGRLMYDFDVQGEGELGAQEGDEVYIIDDSKSRDWWMCQSVSSGKQGVIPASYIEIIGTTNLEKLTGELPLRKAIKISSPSRWKNKNSNNNTGSRNGSGKNSKERSRAERERIREHDRMQRERSRASKEPSPRSDEDKSMPNYHRVRTWIDSSGSFKVEAEFLGFVDGKVQLHKTNGVKIAVAAQKLSVEDLEYVEKITGENLSKYIDEVIKVSNKRKAAAVAKQQQDQDQAQQKPDFKSRPSATAIINDTSSPKKTSSSKNDRIVTTEPDYDWFEFFLKCGIDIGNCQRYSVTFAREQMDENSMPDIAPSLLRTLGLREGDIIRVMKYLDNKFNRKRGEAVDSQQQEGGLFTNVTGGLKNNNSNTEVSRINPSALPSQIPATTVTEPSKSVSPASPASRQPQNPALLQSKEDDAWAVKPAARSNEDLSKPATPQPQTPQYTGSLQDLVNIKPLEAGKDATKSQVNQPSVPSAPSLTPVKTGSLIQPGQQFAVQGQVNGPTLVPAQKTGTLIPVQRTGGGLIPMQPTGFMPITAQPTGFVPIQATGLIQPLFIGIIPVTTGNVMAGPPTTTFNQPSLQPGGITMPTTTFGQPSLVPAQRTGGLVPVQRTGNGFVPQSAFGQQITGGVPQTSFGQPQLTGGLPQTTFSQQITGGVPQTSFGQPQLTGGLPSTTFGQPQLTGGLPQTSFGQPQLTGGLPQTSFGQPQLTGGLPQTSFGQPQVTGGFSQSSFGQPQVTGGLPQTSFGQPQFNGGLPQTSLGQPNVTGGLSQASFGQPQGYPQTSFGQPTNFGQPTGFSQPTGFGQPPVNAFGQPSYASSPVGATFGQQSLAFNNGMDQMTSMFQNTSLSNGPQQQMPQASFGQENTLQSQPTGFGFGNTPLQSQATGQRKANLQNATPDNPWGF
ncbi:cytoskeletal protein binding protein [Scheffersomyces spartinae]|uniref:Actin cytoskeleton-regulatory complex protein SLA1 n=1 Tax=Scheffersomyces spartinae TaxID=45513 RepID=A0A9P8AJC8_9ASCO|nr:cytoskeletal protein binding protein [Scheffersomyces spartinae]KAG7194640.1 cytoskeletal protein binding protein [Scheffersomyces spartinae]